MEFVFKKAIGFNRIKSGISKKGIRMKDRVQGKEIREYWFQGRESPIDLSWSGESDFLSTGISG